jgi:hypothetical protein
LIMSTARGDWFMGGFYSPKQPIILL